MIRLSIAGRLSGRHAATILRSTDRARRRPDRPVRIEIPHRGVIRHTWRVTELKIGYARVSTHGQDLTAQRNALTALGVADERIYVDHGLTGTNRARPGLREALAA